MNKVTKYFAYGTYPHDDFGWGWQCFACRDEQTGFMTASGADEARENHEQTCRLIDPWLEAQIRDHTTPAAAIRERLRGGL